MRIHYYPFRPNTKEVFDYERRVEATGNRVPGSMSNSRQILNAAFVDLGILVLIPLAGIRILLLFVITASITVWMTVEYLRTLKTWYPLLSPELKRGYWHVYWKHPILSYFIFIMGLAALVIIAFGLQILNS